MALCVGLAFGLCSIAEPLDNTMHIARNKLRAHPTSGSIVLVGLDDRSLAEIGAAPWSSDQLRGLLDRLRLAKARRVHLDLDIPAGSPRALAGLRATLQRFDGRLSLPTRFAVDPVSGARSEHLPPAPFADSAQLVNSNIRVSWDNSVWFHPYSAMAGGRRVPSLATALAGKVPGPLAPELFAIDYAIDLKSIPYLSASDLLKDRWKPEQVRGKDVIIARVDFDAKRYKAPGFTNVPAILIHIVAAETLLAGSPINAGWLLPLALSGLLGWGVLALRARLLAIGLLAIGMAALLVGPLLLEEIQVHLLVSPALAVLVTAGASRAWAGWRRAFHLRGTTNAVTGMPNLLALNDAGRAPGGIVVALRVQNHAQIRSSLALPHQKELAEQIVTRLSFGTEGATIYQADDGTFVWVSEAPEAQVQQQLEGLYALFRSPAVVGSRLIDVAVTFGLDLDTGRPLMQRVSSTLVAADEAARDGLRWKCFDTASLDDAEWSMSLLGRLDQALENGQLWVAYQAKVDCATGAIVGAEALVRWTHPEKGNIYPDQFIGAAEKSGRIVELTRFVLDTAVAAAAAINRGGRDFVISVNLSANLLDNGRIVDMVAATLEAHGLAPHRLILEVTETSTLSSSTAAMAVIERLSALGVQFSIDDYGTGFSTLEYLKRIPAQEIKIDRTFVGMLHRSQSDRIMVNSTIQLAHSLGRKVVAEGVENGEILEELARMGCDLIQGYYTGRPVALEFFLESLSAEGTKRKAA